MVRPTLFGHLAGASTNPAEALRKLGGARVILATAPNSKAMSALIDGLGPNGELMVIGAASDRTIQSWAARTPAASEDTLHFAELTGVRPMVKTYPLEKATEAYTRMISGKAKFRVVLTLKEAPL